MIEFFEVLTAEHGRFLRYALFAGLLASPAFGAVGSLVVTRKISGLAGAISHCTLAGVGGALFLQSALGWGWLSPLWGALIVGTAAALLLTWITTYAQEREDTWISFLWAGGMAVGLLFFAKTPQYVDPMSYLFGNILLIRLNDLWLLAGLNLLIGSLMLCFHNPLLSVCFDEHYAKITGQQVFRMKFLLLFLTTLTIILMVQVLGVVLVIALLVLPAATAALFVRRIWAMMAWAGVLSAIAVAGGLWLSYGLDLPAGPVTILLAGLFYGVALFYRKVCSS
jgi:zinc transport system permease protein